ncbi:hypothetical protein [Segniliparus rugosus]|uniref:Uncharacterized protein n=1 Tax=Segniliparus rugosus (strain ATCC BAA-974 / DSM 45345 / CCUG 50838 / CIP 108380 / JCM 13579 / CDC 945) TaxID=679197 RepID=E5XKU5_SEGRC|nr:hypothetical protein [Segniliparus rugosus]EFV15030.1 hypothetical protein HMPREF9336_00114 [Segniliparus rugosus ATCC BAA-974]
MTSPTTRVERLRSGDERFGWAKMVEYEIFGVQNDFTGPADRAAGEMTHYRCWERSSEFYVSFDGHEPHAPVAVLRALRWDPRLGLDSFSTLRDSRRFRAPDGKARNFLHPDWDAFFADRDPRRIAELATQGVRKGRRRAGAMEQIWLAFFDDLVREEVELVTVALVVPLFQWYRELLGDRIHQIGDILPDYIGADSVPAVIDIGGSYIADVARDFDNGRSSLLAASARSALRADPSRSQHTAPHNSAQHNKEIA